MPPNVLFEIGTPNMTTNKAAVWPQERPRPNPQQQQPAKPEAPPVVTETPPRRSRRIELA